MMIKKLLYYKILQPLSNKFNLDFIVKLKVLLGISILTSSTIPERNTISENYLSENDSLKTKEKTKYNDDFGKGFINKVPHFQTENDIIEIIKDTITDEEEFMCYMVIEDVPTFNGDLNKWLKANIKYPEAAFINGIEGRVFMEFIIEKDGSLSEIKTVKGVHELLDKEAQRVLELMPNWRPGMQRNKPIRVRFTIPINFIIQDYDPTINLGGTVKMPLFPQGDIHEWIRQNITLPKSYFRSQEKIKIKFFVETDGSIDDVTINSTDEFINQKIISLLKQMPKWTPGMYKENIVSFSISLTLELRKLKR